MTQVNDGDCILLSQDLKFSRGACFARHVMTRQLLNPDHENLGEGLKTFSGMCTLSNCIFQSFSVRGGGVHPSPGLRQVPPMREWEEREEKRERDRQRKLKREREIRK